MARRLLAVVALVFGAMTFNVGAASATTGPSPAATLPSRALLADVIAHASATPRGGSVSADAITPETATTTYQLVPAKNVIQVTVDLRLENHEKSTTSYYTCVQYYIDPWYGLVAYDATCSRTTSYYLNSTTAWTEDNVANLKVTADKGTVTKSVAKKQDGYTLWKLGFSNLFNGQVRKLHMTYSIAGGKPRSASTTRAGQAYAHFCATGNGIDGGTVNVIMPSGYVSSASSDQGTITSSSGGGRTIYASGMQSDPADYYMCVDGTNEAAYHRATVTTPEGRSVTIEAWPEDSTWLTSVQAQASDAAAALERLIGQALPGTGALTIREVAADQLGDYSGTFDSKDLIADVSETLDQGTVAHELSHDWFNDTLFTDRWLAEGSAGWAESATTPAESPCAAPGPYPGTGTPHLLSWQFIGPRRPPPTRPSSATSTTRRATSSRWRPRRWARLECATCWPT